MGPPPIGQLLMRGHELRGIVTNPQPAHTPIPADSLAEIMGANIHTQQANTQYGDRQTVADGFANIGIRYAREFMMLPAYYPSGGPNQVDMWTKFNAKGVKMLTRTGKPNGSEGTIAQFAAYAKSQWGGDTGGVIHGFENVNEWNGAPDATNGKPGNGTGVSPITGYTYSKYYPEWAEQFASWQTAMWNNYQADSQLDGISIYTGTLVALNATNAKALFDVANIMYGTTDGLGGKSHFGNFHVYCGDASKTTGSNMTVPSSKLSTNKTYAQQFAPGNPVAVTEFGMYNALQEPMGQSTWNPPYAWTPHSEAAAGVYWPRAPLECAQRGLSKIFQYEFVDDWGITDTHLTDKEVSFGLYRGNWTIKPGGTALKNMFGPSPNPGLFNDPGAPVAMVDLHYLLVGPATLRSLLYQKRNGQYLLAMWRDVSVWDPVTQTMITVAPSNATVTFEDALPVKIYKPSTSATPVDYGLVSSFTYPMAGEVVVALIG